LGVPPEKVIDVMALMGDTVDNIPGAKDPNERLAEGERRKPGIGEVGARELIQQFGSVEETLRRAGEVKRASYREALQKYGKFVLLSKELAKISTHVPFEINLPALALREPDVSALATLYRELGFSSLLKELGTEAVGVPAPSTADSEPAVKADYAQIASAAEFHEYLAKLQPKEPLAIWLNLETGERETEGFGTRIASIEVSSRAGEGRSVWMDEKGEALKGLVPLLVDSKRQKIVHDARLFQLLTWRAA